MSEPLAMTPYMMQIALNQTLKEYFKGKKYCGPGGEKELNFYEQNLPIDTGSDYEVDLPAACSPYIITELGDTTSPVGNKPMTVEVTMYICTYDEGLQRPRIPRCPEYRVCHYAQVSSKAGVWKGLYGRG